MFLSYEGIGKMTFRSSWLLGLIFVLAACSDGGDQGEDRGDGPVVVGGTVTQAEFISEIEAVGTAFANEQTIITSPVTERIERIDFADGSIVRRGAVIARLSSGEESAALN